MIDRTKLLAAAAVLALSAGGLAACNGERKAESETGAAEAEVKTDQPEAVVSDQSLQNAADNAASAATTGTDASATTGAAAGATTTTPAGGSMTTTTPGAASATTTTTTTPAQ